MYDYNKSERIAFYKPGFGFCFLHSPGVMIGTKTASLFMNLHKNCNYKNKTRRLRVIRINFNKNC